MKAKNMTLVSLSIFSLVFLMTLISASITLTPSEYSVSIEQGATGSFEFTIHNNELAGGQTVENITVVPSNFTSGENIISNSNIMVEVIPLEILPGEDSIVPITITIPADQALGEYMGKIIVGGVHNVSGHTISSRELNLSIIVTESTTEPNPEPTPETFSFCDYNAVNYSNLELRVDINNNGEGSDNEWLPLDTIKVEVELRNDQELYLDNVVFELGLFKEGSSNNIIDDMIWISSDDERVEIGDIDPGEKDKFTFEFRIDPNEVDDAQYKLAVKAYPDRNEDLTCIDFSTDLSESKFGDSDTYADIRINKENDKNKMIVIDESSISTPISASCNQNVIFSADIYNIGDRDFQDQIKVSLYNSELGLDLEEIVLGDMDSGDKTQVSFSFNVPKDAEEKQYPLLMKVYYDYDKDKETYDRISDDAFYAYLKVEGNCAVIEPVSVSATLESGGLAGENLVVKAIITNTGSEARDYILNAEGYTEWASTVSLSESVFTLDAGASKEVFLTFLVDEKASGDYLFSIEVLSEGQLIANQAVSVSIEGKGKEANGFGFLTGSVIGENPYIWGIGLLNLILIIIIIILIVRVSRK